MTFILRVTAISTVASLLIVAATLLFNLYLLAQLIAATALLLIGFVFGRESAKTEELVAALKEVRHG